MSEELYQEFLIELYKNPMNYGEIADADYKADIDNPTCGDRLTLFIKVKDDTIEEAKFIGKGCVLSQASASLFTGYLKGKKISDLDKITKDDVLALLKINLSRNPTRMRCALLPLDAMKKSLKK